MSREEQIKFMESCQTRVETHAQGWLRDPKVRAALHNPPPEPEQQVSHQDFYTPADDVKFG